MLDQDTKRRIDNACDILVGKVPTPLAQVEQITLALIYKFMNDMDKRSLAMGGQASYFTGDYEKYSWDNLMDNRIGAQERANLYEEGLARLSTNGELPELFRGIFKEASVPYRAARTLNLFLKEIDGFSYEDSENLGDAYEYLLGKTGSQGEAGQFRTPRHIIDFIVQVVDPSKYDAILDPACGTAGFLISALKHIYKANSKEIEGDQLSPVEQLALSNSVYGYDITPDMVRISRVNMFLHNIKLPHIYEYDTLSSLDRWDDNFSCILANPPFMTPKGGVTPHNRFSIPSTRSEVLFVDYIMEHLTLDGKAGVIVPEGIIFNSGSAHKALRKKLISENYLWGVVSLPGGVFNPYAGVKTSVLLIDRQIAKRSDKIIFFKVENDGYNLGAQRRPIEANDLPHAVAQALAYKDAVMMQKAYVVPDKGVILVEKAKLAESAEYNLSAERYIEVEKPKSLFKIYCLTDLITVVTPPYKLKTSEYLDKGILPVIDQSQNEVAGWTNDYEKAVKTTKPLIIFGDHTCAVKYAETDFCQGADGIKILEAVDNVIPRFLFYILKNTPIESRGYKRHFTYLKELKIPLPPLSFQEEIVAELDSYQKIIDGAKQILDNWKPLINIDPDWQRYVLKDLCYVDGLIDTSPHPDGIYIGADSIEEGTGRLIKKESIRQQSIRGVAVRFSGKKILYSKLRPYLNKVTITHFDGYCSTDIYPLSCYDSILYEYLYYVIKSHAFLQTAIGLQMGARLPRINKDQFLSMQISVPDLHTQQAIVDRIENEQKLVESNRQLIELYVQKTKKRIDKLWKS